MMWNMLIAAALALCAFAESPTDDGADAAKPSDEGAVYSRHTQVGAGDLIAARRNPPENKGRGPRKARKDKGKRSKGYSPWGKANVLVGVSGGLAFGMMDEAPATGDEGQNEGGVTSTTCVDDECTQSDSTTNAAGGLGTYSRVSLLIPAVFDDVPAAPRLSWSRQALSLAGHPHVVPTDGTAGNISGTLERDRADYSVVLQQAELGLEFGTKFGPRSRWFFIGEFTGGYAWGAMQTTRASQPTVQAESSLYGAVVGFDMSIGLMLHKHVFLALSPFSAPRWLFLRTDNADALPFLPSTHTLSAVVPAKAELLIGF